MARRKKHNPERRAFRGISYRKGARNIRRIREEAARRADAFEARRCFR